MEPLPDLTTLRESLQRQHLEHVQVELDLVRTFLDMHELEQNSGELEAAAKSLYHAQRALSGALKGLPNIDAFAKREEFATGIKELEAEIARKSMLKRQSRIE